MVLILLNPNEPRPGNPANGGQVNVAWLCTETPLGGIKCDVAPSDGIYYASFPICKP